MKLADIIVKDAIRSQIQADNRDEAIAEMVNALVESGAIPKAKASDLIEAIIAREAQATTGLGKGVALPHAKFKGIKKPIATFGVSHEGIDFNSLDSQPVYSLIMLISNPDEPDEHLQAMETIFRHVQRDLFRKFLHQAESNEAIEDLIEEADQMD